MSLPLIVGFDGSTPSLAAAEWAATKATLSGAPVRLALAHWAHREGTPVPEIYARLHAEAVELLTRTVEDMRHRHPGLTIDSRSAGPAPSTPNFSPRGTTSRRTAPAPCSCWPTAPTSRARPAPSNWAATSGA